MTITRKNNMAIPPKTEAERNEREREHARRWDNGDSQRENMLDVLSQYQSELDNLAITPDERELVRLVRELTQKTITAKLKGLRL